jgi:hypothetical protein
MEIKHRRLEDEVEPEPEGMRLSSML